MKLGSYTTIEYGGKYSGHQSICHTLNEFVLTRDELAQVIQCLRRSSKQQDLDLVKNIFYTIVDISHCENCEKYLDLNKHHYHKYQEKILCEKCYQAFTDIEYSKTLGGFTFIQNTQKSRTSWCKPELNYVVTAQNYDMWCEQYEKLFTKLERKL